MLPEPTYTTVSQEAWIPMDDGVRLAATLTFPSGVMAVSMEDVWSGPREEGFDSDIYIKWRVEARTVWRRARSAGPTARPRR